MSVYDQPLCLTYYLNFDKHNLLVYLAKDIWIEDTIDLDHFINSTNSFNIQKPEAYRKIIAFDWGEKCSRVTQ